MRAKLVDDPSHELQRQEGAAPPLRPPACSLFFTMGIHPLLVVDAEVALALEVIDVGVRVAGQQLLATREDHLAIHQMQEVAVATGLEAKPACLLVPQRQCQQFAAHTFGLQVTDDGRHLGNVAATIGNE